MNFSISLKGIDHLLKVVGQDFRPVVKTVLHGVGELVRDRVAQAPGPVSRPIKWASEKQRRYVMAQVRRYGPWVRESHPLSQRLIASWTVRDEDWDTVVVGNKTTYGPWVQAKEFQQPMHSATNWVTDEDAIEAVAGSGDVERLSGEAIESALWGRA